MFRIETTDARCDGLQPKIEEASRDHAPLCSHAFRGSAGRDDGAAAQRLRPGIPVEADQDRRAISARRAGRHRGANPPGRQWKRRSASRSSSRTFRARPVCSASTASRRRSPTAIRWCRPRARTPRPPRSSRTTIDLLRDLAPVGLTGNSTFTLVVSPKLGVKTLAELLALAKSKPGELKFGSVGNGSSQHLVAEMLIAATKIELTHVPYRGEAPAVPDLATGRIDLMFMASAKQYIDGGQVVGLGVSGGGAVVQSAGSEAAQSAGTAGLRGRRLERDHGAEGHAGCRHRKDQRCARRGAQFGCSGKVIRRHGLQTRRRHVPDR